MVNAHTNAAPRANSTIVIPPAGQFYHAVYPGGITGEEDDLTLADVTSYETTVGKSAAWIYFSHNWYRDRAFPLATATWIRDHGATPYIRLMLRGGAENLPNRPFQLYKILRGRFDNDLRAWARAARDFGSPIIVEYGAEMNGNWFPWNGKWNGGKIRDGYGDPKFPDGPERFRDAYRHIIDVMRAEGADNLTWGFHVNGGDFPPRAWNRFEKYYPGDAYVDWLGVSVYGAQTPQDDWCDPFRDALDTAYPRLDALAPTKPIFVLEFGVTDGNPLCDQAAWAHNALADLTSGRWARVKGFSWWNETWQNDGDPAHDTDMRVQGNPALASEFQTFVGNNANVLGQLQFQTAR
ncbi:MAG: beta-mannanase [Chloroflexi bacterium]|nr:beta-mannanase [Chloroflexota bacterium]